MMYENFRHTHGSGSGAGMNEMCLCVTSIHCYVDWVNLISLHVLVDSLAFKVILSVIR